MLHVRLFHIVPIHLAHTYARARQCQSRFSNQHWKCNVISDLPAVRQSSHQRGAPQATTSRQAYVVYVCIHWLVKTLCWVEEVNVTMGGGEFCCVCVECMYERVKSMFYECTHLCRHAENAAQAHTLARVRPPIAHTCTHTHAFV